MSIEEGLHVLTDYKPDFEYTDTGIMVGHIDGAIFILLLNTPESNHTMI